MPCDFRLSPAIEAFREKAARFLEEEMASGRTAGHADRRDLTGLDEAFERAHHRRAAEAGFLGVSAPSRFGGGGRPAAFASIYQYEAAYHDAPSIDTALVLCGPPILAFGSPEQQAAYLPSMVQGMITGCIAYSEHQAGSDLAAVGTTARRDGGRWRLDGTKTLVTGAHKADLCVTLARSDPEAPTRTALTMFVFPLPQPGLVVRRRETVNGWTLSELEFDDVRLGDDSVLGTVGSGWAQVGAALGQERSGVAHLGWAARLLDELERWAGADPGRLDDARRDALTRLDLDLATGMRLAARVLWRQEQGESLTWEPAAAKIHATELLQRVAATAADAVGLEGLGGDALFPADRHLPLGGRLAWAAIEAIHPTIGAGANDLLRDGIARQLLGLGRSGR